MSDMETAFKEYIKGKTVISADHGEGLQLGFYAGWNRRAQHQAAQADKLAEALEPFVQQYAHISDEELENVSGKFFFERMMNARTALKAYRGK